MASSGSTRREASDRTAINVWSYGFAFYRTRDGPPLRMPTIVDESTRKCPAIDFGRKLNSDDVLEGLPNLFL